MVELVCLAEFYERVVAFKNKGKKVLVAIGGWNDSEGDKYSRLVNSPSKRKRFIEHVLQFIEKYGFQGLDLDWEYPVCWQVSHTKKRLMRVQIPKNFRNSGGLQQRSQIRQKGLR